jgi:hypothetical protein
MKHMCGTHYGKQMKLLQMMSTILLILGLTHTWLLNCAADADFGGFGGKKSRAYVIGHLGIGNDKV